MKLLELCAGVLVLGVLSSCANSEGGDVDGAANSEGASSASAVDSTWRAIAAGPLAPRHGVAAAWTGSEVVLVGGDTQTPCPPGADCAYSPRPSADAAAYDPATDTWRELPDAPSPIADGRAWWSGEELIVVGSGHTFSFDPVDGDWRRLDPSPAVGPLSVPTDVGLVFVAYDQQVNEQSVDWLLDVETGRWSALARDPFGESYDRSMAWDGARLWLLSMAVENHFKAHEGAPSRLAVLANGQWEIVEARTPRVTYEQHLWWYDDHLVVPAGSYGGRSYAFDPDADAWSELSSTGGDTCAAPAAGPGPNWLSGGGSKLITGDAGEAVSLPPCPALTGNGLGPDLAVWADDELLVWGADFKRTKTTGLIWAPPPAA